MSAKRYNIDIHGDVSEAAADEHAEWVTTHDYAALEQRNAELEAALKLLLINSSCSEHQRLIITQALDKKATP